MKYRCLWIWLVVGAAFAHINPPPPGPSITGCAKWSGLTFCKNWFGPAVHAVSEAGRCKANLGADDFVIYNQYQRVQGQPPRPYKKIYVRNCLKWTYGTVASNPMSTSMANQVLAFFPDGAYASNSHYTAEGQIKLYVVPGTEGEAAIYETTFDETGNLLEITEIDPETNEYYATQLDWGLGFAPVVTDE